MQKYNYTQHQTMARMKHYTRHRPSMYSQTIMQKIGYQLEGQNYRVDDGWN